jgi:hypothetical protein
MAAGFMHAGILLAGCLVPQVLDWRSELRKLDRLSQHVVWMHGAFIVMTILGFGLLSIFSSDALASGSGLARSVCALIAVFWGSRLVLQLFMLEPGEYLKNWFLKGGYHLLTVTFALLASIYVCAAIAGGPVILRPPVTADFLKAAAIVQVAFAALNFFVVRIMKWRAVLDRAPLLLREVFEVHSFFISVILLLFGVMTWKFADLMAGSQSQVANWLAAAIGIFWAVRTIAQICYYSSSHWRHNTKRTVTHILLLAIYGGMSGVYLCAGFSA